MRADAHRILLGRGPDLHVYLTNGTDEAAVAAGKQIDPVAFDKDSQSFMLNGVDASMYKDVVIHCDKAKAVFGAAALS
ncbi:DM13 domain-containing protein [Microbacterium azadirachtae]|uniref:DM13 domain-containing protein n=1 Tax=Microbacterium azadirachtae TaxID=582680 RepID=UPI003F752380